jgi:hypothetical protein
MKNCETEQLVQSDAESPIHRRIAALVRSGMLAAWTDFEGNRVNPLANCDVAELQANQSFPLFIFGQSDAIGHLCTLDRECHTDEDGISHESVAVDFTTTDNCAHRDRLQIKNGIPDHVDSMMLRFNEQSDRGEIMSAFPTGECIPGYQVPKDCTVEMVMFVGSKPIGPLGQTVGAVGLLTK